MYVEIRTKAAQFLFLEYINRIFHAPGGGVMKEIANEENKYEFRH